MAITLVDVVQPAVEASNSATHNITTPAGVLAGDFLLLFVSYSGTATNSLTTNPVGFVKLGDVTPGSSSTSTVYYKQNCVTGDSSQVITITTSSATIRITKIMARFRGVAASGSAFLGFAQQAALNQTSYAAPTLATTGPNGVQVQCAAFTITGQVANSGRTIPDLTAGPTPAAGITKIAGHWTGSSVTTGNHEAGMGWNSAPMANGASVGGTVWSPESPAPATTGHANAWTLVLAPVAVAVSSRPTSVITSTGWSNVGPAANILGALADDLTTTYAETGDNPNGTQPLEDKVAEIAAQSIVRVKSKLEAVGGNVSWLIQLICGTTVIASKTRVLTPADGIVDDELATTTVEAAAITDWANLRPRRTPTTV